VDALLRAVDLLAAVTVAEGDDFTTPGLAYAAAESVVTELQAIAGAGPVPPVATSRVASPPTATRVGSPAPAPGPAARMIGAERLLTLAGEALVVTRELQGTAADGTRGRRTRRELLRAVEELRQLLERRELDEATSHALAALRRAATADAALQAERAAGADALGQRLSRVTTTLYEEVLDARMTPFGDCALAFPRLIRDVARELGREARLEVVGDSTPVDREVLRRLDAPLRHLLANAVDHGIETPAERAALGKPTRGTVRLSARHGGGRLLVTVDDDGRGVDAESLRARVVARGLASAAAVASMTQEELLAFLFLPGFSLRDEVTAISGRGVGLDVVLSAVRELGGHIRVSTPPEGGTRVELQLPLTLSVLRGLLVRIGDGTYALPLARLTRVLRVPPERIESVEGRQHFALDGRQVGLVWSHQVLGLPVPSAEGEVPVVVVEDQQAIYGIVVDRLLGERELVLRGLDARVGKVPNVGGAVVLPDGSPALVLDMDDLMRSIASLVAGGRPDPLRRAAGAGGGAKRVLVVDDSLTVRELERKMIEGHGYAVDVAVDGMEGWNAVRTGRYDLVVTDVDMPRLDGIELVSLIKGDAGLRGIPVMIVSYKDRDEDRRRGLDAGADYYLTKGSFYDETMLRAIEDLIGPPR
jgi:two-component system sensor histidine kinase and response regulator WspE